MSNEERLSTPLEDHALSLGYFVQVYFDLGHSQDILGRSHHQHEVIDNRFSHVSSGYSGSW